MKPLCFIFNEGCGTYKEKKIHAQKINGVSNGKFGKSSSATVFTDFSLNELQDASNSIH